MCLLWQAASGVWHSGTQMQHSSCHSKHDRELRYVLLQMPEQHPRMPTEQLLLQALRHTGHEL